MKRYVEESFLALKAVDGTQPPIAKVDLNYEIMMKNHHWRQDPMTKPHTDRFRFKQPARAVKTCNVGWHSFPLNELSHWWPKKQVAFRNRGMKREIWVVEVWGEVDYSSDKLCSSHMRFIELLTDGELNSLSRTNPPQD